MSFFKAVISSLTDSKSEKTSKHVQELAAETLEAIRAIETEFPNEAHKIALACRKLVIALPRGKEGFNKAYYLYYDQKEQKSFLHAAAWLASRLILADHVVESAGGHGLNAMAGIPLIQGHIEAFFKRHNVPEWRAPYYEMGFVDAHGEESTASQDELGNSQPSVTEVSDAVKGVKAATKANKVLNEALAGGHLDVISSTEVGVGATSAFLAGLAIEFGKQEGVPDSDIPIVVEVTLSKTMGEEASSWYGSNLSNLPDEDPAILAINAGRAAALLTSDDDITPAALLGAVLKKAASN